MWQFTGSRSFASLNSDPGSAHLRAGLIARSARNANRHRLFAHVSSDAAPVLAPFWPLNKARGALGRCRAFQVAETAITGSVS